MKITPSETMSGGGRKQGGGSATIERRPIALCAFFNQNYITLDRPPLRVKGTDEPARIILLRVVVKIYLIYLMNSTSILGSFVRAHHIFFF